MRSTRTPPWIGVPGEIKATARFARAQNLNCNLHTHAASAFGPQVPRHPWPHRRRQVNGRGVAADPRRGHQTPRRLLLPGLRQVGGRQGDGWQW